MKRKPWTTKEIEYLKRYAGKRHDHEIAEALGRTVSAVCTYRIKLGLPEKKAVYRIMGENDEILAIGTAEECAKILGVQTRTIYNYIHKAANRKRYAERIS